MSSSHTAHFIFKEQPHRLHQLKIQIVRQTAYVVVGFYAIALQDIGINGPLG